MRDVENLPIGVSEPAPDADDGTSAMGANQASRRALDRERARKLGRRLRVDVAVDQTGWLGVREVELSFRRAPDGTIRPAGVRVAPDANEDDIVGSGGIVARCAEYNAAICALRQLGEQLAKAVRHGRIRLVPGSPVVYAHHQLARIDELIAHRQAIMMGNGVVRAGTLIREIQFFKRCDAHLAPVVLAAKQVDRSPRTLASSAVRRVWRWLCR